MLVLWMNNLCVLRYVPTSTWASDLRHFRYMRDIHRDLTLIVLINVIQNDVGGIFAEYHEHLVPFDIHSVSTHHTWIYLN